MWCPASKWPFLSLLPISAHHSNVQHICNVLPISLNGRQSIMRPLWWSKLVAGLRKTYHTFFSGVFGVCLCPIILTLLILLKLPPLSIDSCQIGSPDQLLLGEHVWNYMGCEYTASLNVWQKTQLLWQKKKGLRIQMSAVKSYRH